MIKQVPLACPDFLENYTMNQVIGAVNNFIGGGKLTLVDNKDKLPTPVNGVITLVDNNSYFVVDAIDLTGDRIVCGLNNAIFGTSSENSRLFSTGLDANTPLITSQYSLPLRNIALTHGLIFDLNGDGVTTALDWVAVNMVDSANIGTIANYTNVIIKDSAILNSAGLTFDGTIGTVGFDGCLFAPYDGGTALIASPTLNITRRFRVIYSAFVVFGSRVGIDFSESVTVPNEAYILDTVSFAGGATYIQGVDSSSNKALFINNTGITNSSSVGFMFDVDNALLTDVVTQGTWYKANIVTSAGADNSKFNHTDNRLTYAGFLTQNFNIYVNASISVASPNQNISIAIAKNGVVITDTEMRARCATSGQDYPVSTGYTLSLSSNDYIEVFVKNNSSSADIRVTDLNCLINKVPA